MATLGTLFLVATPIGNLGDVTARAAETLRACDVVVAEDTRRTRQLLTHLGIGGKAVERLDAHAAAAAGVRVVPIPGPSAVLAALVASGMAGDGHFRFVGFLPRDGAERREALALICATP